MALLALILPWFVYYGFTALVIVVDRNRERAKAEAGGGVDFMDRSITPYLVLGVLCGPLPLIFYFGSTRKTALGWLTGIGAAALVYAATVVFATVLNLVLAKAH